MFCEIARKLEGDDLEKIQALEEDLGLTIVAFTCRSLDPAREEKLEAMMRELGPMLQAPLAEPDDVKLRRLREAEQELGLTLIAVNAS
jgi:hypothetical protein